MKLAVYLVCGAAALACLQGSASAVDAARSPAWPPIRLAQQAPPMGESDSDGAGEVTRDPLTAEDFAYLSGSTLLFEIEAARIAASRASDPDVRAFAERVVADREGLLRDLRAAVAPGQAPGSLDEDNRKIVDALGAEQGAQLDVSFVGMMIDTQEETLDLNEELKDSVRDERLRAYVDASTPRIAAMLKDAEALEQKLKPAERR